MPPTSSPHGNDPARTLKLPDGQKWILTYWDVWFLVLLLNDFQGDWSQMTAQLRQTWPASGFQRETRESLLSHLTHLRQQLATAGLSPQAALGRDGPAWLKSQRTRARNHLLKKEPTAYDQSEWMRHTPRREREARALRGYWPLFPISPAPYADALERLFKTSGYYTENQSWGLEGKLSAFLDRQETEAELPELLALYRAALAVIVEKMNIVDDSYGVIGDLYQQILDGYWQLDRTAAGLPPEVFLPDIIELMLWEDYAFSDASQPAFYASLSPAEAGMAKAILQAQATELQALELDDEAEDALTHLGLLCAQQEQWDTFVELAQQMGCRHWRRITTLAETAEKRRRPALALQVYEAALAKPGIHHDGLQKEYEALKTRLTRRKTARRAKS